MRKWWFIISLSLLIILIGTGCTSKTLLGENSITEQEVTSFLPEGAKLYVPAENKNFTRWGLQDIDQDGAQELYAFYQLKGQLGVVILEQTLFSWEKKHQVEIANWQEVSYLDWKDVNQDQRIDLIVGQKLLVAPQVGVVQKGQIVIFSFQEEKVDRFIDEQTEYFIVDNLDEDPNVEVVLISDRKNDKDEKNIRLFKYTSSGYQNFFSGTQPEEGKRIITDVQVGKIDSKRKGIFISEDWKSVEGLYMTHLLVVEENRIKPLTTVKSDEEYPKISTISPQDIDKDGVMEIGIVEHSDEWDLDETPEMVAPYFEENGRKYFEDRFFRTETWKKWKNNQLQTVAQSYINRHMGMQIIFPSSWNEKVNVYSYKDSYSVGASFVDATVEGPEQPAFFFIIRMPKDGKDEIMKEYPGQSSFVIRETPEHLFLGILPSQENLEMFPEIKDKIPTEQEAKKMFQLIPK